MQVLARKSFFVDGTTNLVSIARPSVMFVVTFLTCQSHMVDCHLIALLLRQVICIMTGGWIVGKWSGTFGQQHIFEF